MADKLNKHDKLKAVSEKAESILKDREIDLDGKSPSGLMHLAKQRNHKKLKTTDKPKRLGDPS